MKDLELTPNEEAALVIGAIIIVAVVLIWLNAFTFFEDGSWIFELGRLKITGCVEHMLCGRPPLY